MEKSLWIPYDPCSLSYAGIQLMNNLKRVKVLSISWEVDKINIEDNILRRIEAQLLSFHYNNLVVFLSHDQKKEMWILQLRRGIFGRPRNYLES